MNSLEEIALKVAEETDAYCEHEMEQCVSRGDVFGDYREFRDKEFARRLVAALGAQPAVSREYQGRDGKWNPFIGEWHYKNTVADGTWPIRELFAAPVLPSVPAIPSGEDVQCYLYVLLDEDKRRGSMFPQTSDEQEADSDAIHRVCGMVRWYVEQGYSHGDAFAKLSAIRARASAAPSPQEDAP